MMTPAKKVWLIIAGYVLALLVASGVVAMYIASTDTPDRQASSGMYGFGDSYLFLAVFAVAAIPATGAAFYFLRQSGKFWRVVTVAAPLIATTAIIAALVNLAMHESRAMWAELSPLRVLIAPAFALFFYLAGAFAPKRSARIALFVSGVVETAVFGVVSFIWFSGAG